MQSQPDYKNDVAAFARDVLKIEPNEKQQLHLAGDPVQWDRTEGKTTALLIQALHRCLHNPGDIVTVLVNDDQTVSLQKHVVRQILVEAGLGDQIRGYTQNSLILASGNGIRWRVSERRRGRLDRPGVDRELTRGGRGMVLNDKVGA